MRTQGCRSWLASRWLFGFRILIPMACGKNGAMAPFLLANVVAGSIWAIPTALVAYYAASTLEKLLGAKGSGSTSLQPSFSLSACSSPDRRSCAGGPEDPPCAAPTSTPWRQWP